MTGSTDEPKRNQTTNALMICLLLLAAVVVRVNTFGYGFVWDDGFFLFEQQAVRPGAGPAQWFGTTVHGLYRPVRAMAYALTTSLFDNHPLGYRLVGVTLDGLLAVLIYLLLRSPFGALPAFLATLIWVVHPMHVERVVFITATHDLWGLVLMMGALLLALRIRSGDLAGPAPWIALALLCLLAVFGSEEALLLPGYFALIAVVLRDPKVPASRSLRLLGLLCAVAAVFVFVRLGLIGLAERTALPPVESGGRILPVMLAVFGFYFSSTFVPLFGSAAYPPFSFSNLAHPAVLYGAVVLLATAAVATIGLARRSWIGVVAGWWLIALLPFSNIVPNVAQRQDRYLYMATIALAILAAYLLAWIRQKAPAKMTAAVLISLAVATAYFSISLMQNRVWKDELALWENAYRGCPRCSKVAINYGMELAKRRHYVNARRVLEPVLVPRPGYEMAFVALAAVEMESDHRDRAMVLLDAVLAFNPDYPQALRMVNKVRAKSVEPPP